MENLSIPENSRVKHTDWANRIFTFYKAYRVLGLIVILAFILRIIGLKFGSSLLTHTDEKEIIGPAVRMTVNHTLDPGIPHRPDLFLIYLNYVYLNIVSYLKFGAWLSTTYAAYPVYFTYAARFLIAVIGSLMPIAAWKIGKQGKIDFAIPAALFFGFFPSFVNHSHYVTPDVTITLFALIIIYFSMRYLNTGNNRYLVLATFFVALNTSEKYPGLISLVIVLSAIVIYEIQSKQVSYRLLIAKVVKKSIIFGFLYAGFLILVAPTLFLEYERTIAAILNQARPTHLGADNLGWFGNMKFYAREYLKAGNWLLILLIAPGVYYSIKNRDTGMILGLFGFLYWISLSVLSLHWERWALPMYTAPLIFAAYGAASIHLWRVKPSRLVRPVQYGIIGLIGLGLFLSSLSLSISLTYQDTRYASLLFCEENGITPENSLYESYSPFTPTLGLRYEFHEDYRAGVQKDYIILSSGMYGRFFYEPERYADQVRNYQEIRQKNILIAEFSAFSSGKLSIAKQLDAVAYYVQRYFDKDTPVRLSGPTIQIYATNGNTK